MDILKRVLLISLVVLMASTAWAAGSAYLTVDKAGKIYAARIAWTSNAAGTVSSNPISLPSGVIFGFQHDPEAGVSNLYDVVLQVSYPIYSAASTVRTIEWADSLGGDGANLSNSADGGNVLLTTPFSMPDCTADLVITNAGDAQSGTFIIYIWRE